MRCARRSAPASTRRSGRLEDGSHVHGIQGTPDRAFDEILPAGAARAYPADGPPYPPKGPMQSWMIDTDINLGVDDQIIMDSLVRNDATRIGDIVIYEICAPTAAAVTPAPAPSTPASEPATRHPGLVRRVPTSSVGERTIAGLLHPR